MLECLALSYRELGKNGNAKTVFEAIIKNFPNSRRATNAQAFIDIINKETGNGGTTADTTGTDTADTAGDTTGTDTADTTADATGDTTGEDTATGDGTVDTQGETDNGGLGNAEDVLGTAQ